MQWGALGYTCQVVQNIPSIKMMQTETACGTTSILWNRTNVYDKRVPAGKYIAQIILGDHTYACKVALL